MPAATDLECSGSAVVVCQWYLCWQTLSFIGSMWCSQYYGEAESQRWFVSAPVALLRAPQRTSLWKRDAWCFLFLLQTVLCPACRFHLLPVNPILDFCETQGLENMGTESLNRPSTSNQVHLGKRAWKPCSGISNTAWLALRSAPRHWQYAFCRRGARPGRPC